MNSASKSEPAENQTMNAPVTKGSLKLFWLVAIVVIAVVLGIGIPPRLARSRSLIETQERLKRPPRVLTATVMTARTKMEVTLPGSTAPTQTTVVSARGGGFVRKFLVDLGDRVKAGQVMAEIETPELDGDLRRSKARVDESEKNETLAKTYVERITRMSKEGVASQQQLDEAQSRYNSAIASAESTRADFERLGTLRGFSKVIAPFDGVVTKRSVERGTLVTAGVTPLFELAQVETLKVTVDVPQRLATELKPGMVAQVFLTSQPNHLIPATISRTSGALDPSSRSLRVELELKNDGTLLAGAYVQVRFMVERANPPLIIPASAITVRADGLNAFVLRGQKLELTPLSTGRDLGKEVEVLAGLQKGDEVVLNPNDELQPGVVVDRVETRDAGQ